MISWNAGSKSLIPFAPITAQANSAAQSSALYQASPPRSATEIPTNAAVEVSASLR